MNTLELAKWTVGCKCVPIVRIGIVLPRDGVTAVRLDVPAAGYTADPEGEPQPAHRLGACSVVARCSGGGVALSAAGDSLGAAESWRIAAPEAGHAPDAPCVLVHDVLAGRGFHWETRIDESLPGSLQIRQRDGHILLVNELSIEACLKGVITSEMSGACPLELLKAQCVTARSWMLARTERKHDPQGFDFCNDDCCQRYQGFSHLAPSARRAVDETTGEVMLYRDRSVIDANYSKVCGGIVEAPEPIWGAHKNGQYAVPDAPPDSYLRRLFPVSPGNLDEYLTGDWLRTCDAFCSPQVVPDDELPEYLGAVDEDGGYFRWSVEYSRERLEAILQGKYFDRVGIGGREALATLEDLTVSRRGLSGRAIALNVAYRDRDGKHRIATIEDQYWIRHALHDKFLYSSAIQVQIDRDERGLARTIRLLGSGWGHGAGLCQVGALGMALTGYDYRSILHHYFERITIESVYSR